MVTQAVQTDWDRDVLCASRRREHTSWGFRPQRLNLIRDAMASTNHDLYRFRSLRHAKPTELEHSFTRLSREWRDQTGHLSSIERKAMHPAYQTIIGMGMAAVPYVLKDLKDHGGHWFWALHFMTGLDFSRPNQSREELRNDWLEWGRNQGYDGL